MTSPLSNRPGSTGAASAKKNRTPLIVTVIAVVLLTVAAAVFLPRLFGRDDETLATGYQLTTPGTLTVATEGTYRPFSYHDEGSGVLVGYDVEVAKAVAGKLGLQVQFQETQWDAIFAGLEAARFDVIANQVSINDERRAKYLLSDPYTVSPGVLVVPADRADISSFEDLKGKTTAQSLTSNWYALAQSYGAKVEAVEGWAQSVALLQDGRVDATINDKLTLLDYQKTHGDSGLKIAAETKDPSRSAFALRKGNDKMLTDINTALNQLRADGTLATLGQKYFGQDVSK